VVKAGHDRRGKRDQGCSHLAFSLQYYKQDTWRHRRPQLSAPQMGSDTIYRVGMEGAGGDARTSGLISGGREVRFLGSR
jgi:hypothetical protein